MLKEGDTRLSKWAANLNVKLFENEINRIQIINKMSDKQTKFMKNLQLEIDGEPNHF